jgi:hypothetical protein
MEEPFVVIILGRTCEEWEGLLGDIRGRAGFNNFGNPSSLISNIESFHTENELKLFDTGALVKSSQIDIVLVDCCQVSNK